MDKSERPPAAADRENDNLEKICSRLAGDNLCRCGGTLKGRYCLWSYYRPASAAGKKLLAKDFSDRAPAGNQPVTGEIGTGKNKG